MPEQPATIGPSGADIQDGDEPLVRLVASALFRVAELADRGQRLSVPYPAPLQRALDRLACTFLIRGHVPPQSVADLFQLCRRPLVDWPLTLPEGAVGDDDTLLLGDQITNLCDEWAEKDVLDVEGELFEQSLIQAVRKLCRNLDRQDSYVAFRRMLIESPVISEFDLKTACFDPHLSPLREHLNTCYQRVPLSHGDDGQYRCCINCNGLLLRSNGDLFVCENEACRVSGEFVTGNRIAADDGVLWLRRELRRFITKPGLAELRLFKRLAEIPKLDVELWPGFDSYDTLVRFADGEVWAIDVKDQRNPFLLASQARIPADNPHWDKAFFVFPDARRRERSDYLRAFRHYSEVVSGMVDACFESDIVKRIEKQARSRANA